jgi:hypothetical protein
MKEGGKLKEGRREGKYHDVDHAYRQLVVPKRKEGRMKGRTGGQERKRRKEGKEGRK